MLCYPITMTNDGCILGTFVTDRNLGYACGHACPLGCDVHTNFKESRLKTSYFKRYPNDDERWMYTRNFWHRYESGICLWTRLLIGSPYHIWEIYTCVRYMGHIHRLIMSSLLNHYCYIMWMVVSYCWQTSRFWRNYDACNLCCGFSTGSSSCSSG